MSRRVMGIAVAVCGLLTTMVIAPSVALAHPGPAVPPTVSPDAALSTSGDYATDTFGDPWDFSNDEDVQPVAMVGCEPSTIQTGNPNTACTIARDPGGALVVGTHKGTTIKLVSNWGLELPWGHDAELHPVDAAHYSRLSFSMCNSSTEMQMGIHFINENGGENQIPIAIQPGCNQYSYNLAAGPYQPGIPNAAPWAGKILSVTIISGGPTNSGNSNPGVTLSLDWVRLHTPTSPDAPPGGVPVAKLISPSEDGGADYAGDYGNTWDMHDPGDVLTLNNMDSVNYGAGGITGVTNANDSYVEFPLPVAFNPDKYHRFSADLCFSGEMGFASAPGQGMNGRISWSQDGALWSETQDIIVYPGCHHIAIDLATNPAIAVNDENTFLKSGWRGIHIARLRFDLNEDPGRRNFQLNNVKFADDAAFSTSYPITYQDTAGAGGATADIFATTNRGAFDGVKIAANAGVNGANVNTFTWNGTDANGNVMPNGTYWTYVVMRNGAGVATNYASGPLRIQKPQAPTASFFVPLSPSRLLDTRDGTGGNVVPLGPDVQTEVDVAGQGGVPATGATAVVLNVTVDGPTASSVLTVWPSREGRPGVSSLNFNAGQTVANLVTVKIGDNGRVNVHNLFGYTNVVVDVVGYYTATQPSSGGRYTPIAPNRVLDTGDTNRIGPGATIDVQITGGHGVPATGVTGVALNVTVDGPTAPSYFTVYPTGEGKPNASSLNFTPGLTIANLVLAKLGSGGRVSIWNYDGSARIVADIVGYFSAAGGRFVPVSPQRLIDTRSGQGVAGGQIQQGSSITAQLVAPGSPIPAGALGAVLNVTSAEATRQSYVTVFPSGTVRPIEGSTLNPRPSVPVPNHAYAKLNDGAVDIFNYAGSTDMIVDVFGYIVN